MKKLYARWGDQVHFVDVMIRQAHPGPDAPSYRTFEQKMADARRYQEEEGTPWVVLVDHLEGSFHRLYGGLADPTYLLDREGVVAYYNLWSYMPAMHQAIAALVDQRGVGVVQGGTNARPHLLPALTAGWRGLERGFPQSVVDLETASPGASVATWLGYQLRPLLAPFTQRARPLPTAVKVGLGLGAVGLVALCARRLMRGR
jgi:hypothetical protein